eukprot:gnl/TRDRNA2_/TRDRNA2_201341_c0_seq1.p1 gnl/TRDRNA2_/TRDRNA2_201341_c0~~gnl/TRDRNA2_/TRDRNA2_201341_c0_seq1.p1  ORF type:complete len:321 (+),score=32.52 gnl/TRDRNA2_/TRDRNA2_201341_c0_seq1:85-1047(+)
MMFSISVIIVFASGIQASADVPRSWQDSLKTLHEFDAIEENAKAGSEVSGINNGDVGNKPLLRRTQCCSCCDCIGCSWVLVSQGIQGRRLSEGSVCDSAWDYVCNSVNRLWCGVTHFINSVISAVGAIAMPGTTTQTSPTTTTITVSSTTTTEATITTTTNTTTTTVITTTTTRIFTTTISIIAKPTTTEISNAATSFDQYAASEGSDTQYHLGSVDDGGDEGFHDQRPVSRTRQRISSAEMQELFTEMHRLEAPAAAAAGSHTELLTMSSWSSGAALAAVLVGFLTCSTCALTALGGTCCTGVLAMIRSRGSVEEPLLA